MDQLNACAEDFSAETVNEGEVWETSGDNYFTDLKTDLSTESGPTLFSLAPGSESVEMADYLEDVSDLNFIDKVSAGMVDIVGRVINDDGNRTISFKTNEVIFGGGRLELKALDIPCEYDDLVKVYENVKTVEAPAPKREAKKAPAKAESEEGSKGYPENWDDGESDDNKVHYWKHVNGAYYVQAIGQTFDDMGVDPSDLVEISEAEYKKAMESEAAKVTTTTKADAERAGYSDVETATAKPTETAAPRRTRRVRGA